MPVRPRQAQQQLRQRAPVWSQQHAHAASVPVPARSSASSPLGAAPRPPQPHHRRSNPRSQTPRQEPATTATRCCAPARLQCQRHQRRHPPLQQRCQGLRPWSRLCRPTHVAVTARKKTVRRHRQATCWMRCGGAATRARTPCARRTLHCTNVRACEDMEEQRERGKRKKERGEGKHDCHDCWVHVSATTMLVGCVSCSAV